MQPALIMPFDAPGEHVGGGDTHGSGSRVEPQRQRPCQLCLLLGLLPDTDSSRLGINKVSKLSHRRLITSCYSLV